MVETYFYSVAKMCAYVGLPFHMRLFVSQVRIILNKSDQVDQQQLMRVYGALMWSLGKVFKSPEVCKVNIWHE